MSEHRRRRPSRAALKEWLWPTETLATARARHGQRRPSSIGHLEAARAARRLAGAALALDAPPEEGGGRQIIAELLYREAVRHGMCALLGCDTPAQVVTVFSQASREALYGESDVAVRTSAIRALFRDAVPSQPTDSAASGGRQPGAPPVKELACDIVRYAGRRVHEYRRVLVTVALRWAVVLAGLSAVLVGAAAVTPLARLLDPPDLLNGAAWRLSSAEPHESELTGTLPASRDRPFFFHTAEQDGPWVEIEVPGGPRTVSRVVVKNRSDCCGFRAIPLVVELSEDQKSWTEVARQQSAFGRWSARFQARSARWLRLRVLRRSQLHLENVEAY